MIKSLTAYSHKVLPVLKLKASYETIYKFIFSSKETALNLPSHLKGKKKVRGFYHRKARRNSIINLTPISIRPEYINGRSEFGHFEVDLFIISITERKTRYSKLIYNQSK